MGAYQYEPLDHTKSEIRVLELQPSLNRRSIIKCELIKAKVDHLSEASFSGYKAISYVWGDTAITETIHLHGHDFEVTRNLASALRRLRYRSQKRYLWADAICINQNDMTERGYQVKRMKLIYQNALKVLVWLGEEADGSGQSMDLLDKMAKIANERAELRNSRFLLSDESSGEWKALGCLFARQYWNRVWIRQEVAVAKKVSVLCGDRSIDWEGVMAICRFMDVYYHDIQHLMSESPKRLGFTHGLAISRLRMDIEKQGLTDLLQVLSDSRRCEATDPRDRIYAMLGMITQSKDQDFGGLEPDYSLRREEVFQAAVEYIIHTSRSLKVLSECQYTKIDSGLPSWVPNFEVRRKGNLLKDVGRPSYASTSLIFSGVRDEYIFYSPKEDRLTLDGVICDEVVDIGSQFEGSSKQPLTHNEVLETWRAVALKTFTSTQPPLSEEVIFNTYLQTLIVDQEADAYWTVHGDGEGVRAGLIKSINNEDGPVPKIDLESHFRRNTAFGKKFIDVCTGRRLFGSRHGQIGIALEEVEVGDLICVFLGASVPFVIRKKLDHYVIVGEAYIHGLMYGEALQLVDKGKAKMEKIVLI